MAVTDEDIQYWFERGQEAAQDSLGDLVGPWRGLVQSEEDWETLNNAFEAGMRSVWNNSD